MPLYLKNNALLLKAGPSLSAGPNCCCPVNGACCIGGVCSVTTQAECTSAGGTWQGLGTTCVCAPGDCRDICNTLCPGDPCGSGGGGDGTGGSEQGFNGFGLDF